MAFVGWFCVLTGLLVAVWVGLAQARDALAQEALRRKLGRAECDSLD